MRKIIAVLATLALPLGTFPASAATLAGVTLPDTYPAGGQTLKLNGIALRTVTVLRVRAYVVGLYLPQPSADPSAIMAAPGPKVVLLQYLHEADKARIVAEYREGEQNVITKQNMVVLANNKPIGTFNPDLGRLILAGFIGDHPPSPEVKSGLLGAK